jgi:hypothetical protein
MGLLKKFRSFLRKGKKKSKDSTLGRVRSTSSVYSWPVPRQPQVTNLDTTGIDDVAETTKQLRRNTSPPTPTHATVSYPHRPLSVERVENPPSTQYPPVMGKHPLGKLRLSSSWTQIFMVYSHPQIIPIQDLAGACPRV